MKSPEFDTVGGGGGRPGGPPPTVAPFLVGECRRGGERVMESRLVTFDLPVETLGESGSGNSENGPEAWLMEGVECHLLLGYLLSRVSLTFHL